LQSVGTAQECAHTVFLNALPRNFLNALPRNFGLRPD